jgi:hypothetical protein
MSCAHEDKNKLTLQDGSLLCGECHANQANQGTTGSAGVSKERFDELVNNGVSDISVRLAKGIAKRAEALEGPQRREFELQVTQQIGDQLLASVLTYYGALDTNMAHLTLGRSVTAIIAMVELMLRREHDAQKEASGGSGADGGGVDSDDSQRAAADDRQDGGASEEPGGVVEGGAHPVQ